ncbi:MAG: Vitamin B12 dependent methionine synthase activation subunit [Clostridia bacterium]|nr:Vitamin B12 dependent methionine synthase activation subunit [Clostridia bacterium]
MTELHRYTSPVGQIDRREVYRYLGCGRNQPDPRTVELAESLCKQVEALPLEAVWCRLPLADGYDFGLGKAGRSLTANLTGCRETFLFAATLGLAADRLIRREEALSEARGVIADAVASAGVEAGCNRLCAHLSEIAGAGKYLRPRFSPGYGDFPITVQQPLLDLLSARKLLGLTLTDSLLMLPTKSVSAIVGISPTPSGCRRGCEGCESLDCPYRI